MTPTSEAYLTGTLEIIYEKLKTLSDNQEDFTEKIEALQKEIGELKNKKEPESLDGPGIDPSFYNKDSYKYYERNIKDKSPFSPIETYSPLKDCYLIAKENGVLNVIEDIAEDLRFYEEKYGYSDALNIWRAFCEALKNAPNYNEEDDTEAWSDCVTAQVADVICSMSFIYIKGKNCVMYSLTKGELIKDSLY